MATTNKSDDRLIFNKYLAGGRVLATNVWRGGWQQLVYPSRKAFEEAKIAVEEQGKVPHVSGYTETK